MGGAASTSAGQLIAVALATGLLTVGLVVTLPDHAGDQALEPADQPTTDLATQVDDELLVGQDQLHRWQAMTDRFGTPPGNRPTGSIAAHGYIGVLEETLTGILGPDNVTREAFTFTKWEEPAPGNVSLALGQGADSDPVPVASYIPYSGTTGPQGISAPLVYLGADTDPATVAAADVQGKIALVDVPPVPLTTGIFEAIAYYEHDPGGTVDPATAYDRTWISQIPLLRMIEALEAAGAAGMVAVLDLPPAMAEGAYFPYEGEVLGLPGLFVDRETGDRLKQAAGPTGTPARLTLETTVDDDATSYNLIGTIPGQSDETILLHSHTDGPNSIEDNGPWAAMALAGYFQQVPKEDRARTIRVVLTDGHFAGGFSGGVGAWRFVEAHEDDILADTVAAISLEHLGARELLEGPDGSFELTGLNEPAGLFMPENQALVDASIDMLQREDLRRHLVLRPFEPSTEDPSQRVWPGEGMVFHLSGIPTIQFIAGPTYLLTWGQPTTDALTDYELMWRQLRGFAQLVTDLSHVPGQALASQDPTAVGEPTSVLPLPALHGADRSASLAVHQG